MTGAINLIESEGVSILTSTTTSSSGGGGYGYSLDLDLAYSTDVSDNFSVIISDSLVI